MKIVLLESEGDQLGLFMNKEPVKEVDLRQLIKFSLGTASIMEKEGWKGEGLLTVVPGNKEGTVDVVQFLDPTLVRNGLVGTEWDV